ncbi:MAG: DUF1513 domain-containing protein, partial [Gammaproteobacteria bacterium]|nr:DUF1513 domain-containing protein [Gammaproteobacteria bacterium]
RDGWALHILKGHEDKVNHAAFSPDGKILVTASYDNTARLWDTRDGRGLHILKGHKEWVNYAAFSPDGKTLVTASSDIARLWNTRDGRGLHILKGHKEWVNYAAFSPGGKTLVTASSDDTARLWNTRDGRALYIFKGHEESVNRLLYTRKDYIYYVGHATFSPDGKTLVTTSSDYTARLWPVFQDRGTLIAHVRKVLPRSRLTCEEREKEYFLDFVPRCAWVADENIRGDHYLGEFSEEKAHGPGQSAGRNRYVGGFRDGMKHGHGIYTWAGGERLEGEFIEDLFQAAPQVRLPMPKEADGWVALAWEQEVQDRLPAAFAALDIQERVQPRHPEVWRLHGNVLLQANKAQEALAAYQQQLQRFPDDTWIQGKLGNAYLALEEPGKAISAYRKQLAAEPRNLDCAGREAFLLEQAGISQCCRVEHENLQDVYKGECNAEFQAHGQGRAQGEQAVYEGGFQAGLLHGQGTYHMDDGSVYSGRFVEGTIPELGMLPYSADEFVDAGDEFFDAGKLAAAAKVYALVLQIQPEHLSLLASDVEVALVQGDKARGRVRLKAMRSLLKPSNYLYAIMPFYAWLLEPRQSWESVIKAIDNLNAGVDFDWDFSGTLPAVTKLPTPQRHAAEAFIAFFEGKIQREELSVRLEESLDQDAEQGK